MVKELFAKALQVPEDEWDGFLAAECGDDQELLIKVSNLLRSHREAESFLSAPELALKDSVAADPDIVTDADGGQWIGAFQIECELGQGGFGTVYLARQEKPVKRRVALKVLKLGMDTKQVMARFELEKQAMALMNHPNIASIYDAGATASGRPFFVMEYVEGEKITQFCEARQLSIPERLALFRKVCAAVNHAHQKGVIHRDLKPSNILITENGEAQPKIIDFGIAKAASPEIAGATLEHAPKHFLGTPAYVSPEQLDFAGGVDIDTRSDLYSLGVILYELLAGTPPFETARLRKELYSDVQRIIREEIPPPPSVRRRARDDSSVAVAHAVIPKELDWIAMKSLEKDRERRYESAAALGRDLQNFLTKRPVEAGPPEFLYRLRKWIARHRMASAAAVLLLATFASSVAGFVRANQKAREAANEAHKSTQALQLIDEMFLSAGAPASPQVRPLLDAFTNDLETQIKDQPELSITLLETVGRSYQRLGAFNQAEIYLDQAYSLAVSHYGMDSEVAARVRAVTGWLYRDQGNYRRAQTLIKKALDYQSHTLGVGHEDTLLSLAYLADVLEQTGDTESAEAYSRQWQSALEVEVKAGRLSASQELRIRLATRSPHTGTPLKNVDLARRMLSQARESELNGPKVIAALHEFADAAIEVGDATEAYSAANEARERASTLADDRSFPLRSEAKLGEAKRCQGHYRSGQELLERVLEEQCALLGKEHEDSMRTVLALAEVYLDRQLVAEAEHARRAEAYWRDRFGSDHPLALRAKLILAGFLSLEGRHPDALGYGESVLATARTLYGVGNALALKAERMRVLFYVGTERFSEGRERANEALDRHRSIFGAGHRMTLKCERSLGDLLHGMGRWSEAEDRYHQVLKAQELNLGADHADTLATKRRLALLYESQKRRLDEARQLEGVMSFDPEEKMPPAAAASGYLRYALWQRLHFNWDRSIGFLRSGLNIATSELGQDAAITQEIRDYVDSDTRSVPKRKADVQRLRHKWQSCRESGASRSEVWNAQLQYALALQESGSPAESEKELIAMMADLRADSELGVRQAPYAINLLAHAHWYQGDDSLGDAAILEAANAIERAREPGSLKGRFFRRMALTALGRMSASKERLSKFYDWNDQVEDENHGRSQWTADPRARKRRIPRFSDWRFMENGKDLGTAWREAGYIDTHWPSAPAPFGFGLPTIGTVCGQREVGESRPTTVYFRREFIADAGRRAIIRVRYDDGIAVFINGIEVLRRGLKSGAGSDDEATTARKERLDSCWYDSLEIPPGVIRSSAANVIAVEVHQDHAKDDLAFDLRLETWRRESAN